MHINTTNSKKNSFTVCYNMISVWKFFSFVLELELDLDNSNFDFWFDHKILFPLYIIGFRLLPTNKRKRNFTLKCLIFRFRFSYPLKMWKVQPSTCLIQILFFVCTKSRFTTIYITSTFPMPILKLSFIYIAAFCFLYIFKVNWWCTHRCGFKTQLTLQALIPRTFFMKFYFPSFQIRITVFLG